MGTKDDRRRECQEALDEALNAVAQGALEESLGIADRALSFAREVGDQALLDRVFCHRTEVEIELSRRCSHTRELRQILLRSSDPKVGSLAAYCLARHYELERDYQRAVFYARIAQERIRKTGRAEWIALSRNQVGNLLLATSYVDEACAEFEAALDEVPGAPSPTRAVILDNLGYCRLVQERFSEAFPMLFESLRIVRRLGIERLEHIPRLSLSYGYLTLGKCHHALRHAERALEIAEALEDESHIKNAFFLIGEAHNRLGRSDVAWCYFERLQSRYYPDAPYAAEALLHLDVCSLINLKA